MAHGDAYLNVRLFRSDGYVVYPLVYVSAAQPTP
jgi:hypothetical protein